MPRKTKTNVTAEPESAPQAAAPAIDTTRVKVIERREIEVSALTRSPLNPRREVGDVSDLVDSFRGLGIVLQPLVVRPSGEIVCGERRWTAAKIVGFKTVPCDVVEISDREVLEIQIAENHARKDVDPLDEANAIKRLRDEFHASIEEISSRVGLSRATVARRLRLSELGPEALKALREGKLTDGCVMQAARVQDPKRQGEAVERLLEEASYNDGTLSVAAARDVVERFFLLDLKRVGFSPADASLLPKAGACTNCPSRAANHGDLYGEVDKGQDLCTNAKCFQEKVAAHQARGAALAREAGHDVIEGKAAAKYFKFNRVDAVNWIDLEERAYELNETRTWKKVLQPIAAELDVKVVPDEDGNLHHLVARKSTLEKARAAKLLKKQSNAVTAGQDSYAKTQARDRKRAATARDRDRELLTGVLARLEKDGTQKHELVAWYAVGRQLCDRAEHEDTMAMAKRHELDVKQYTRPGDALARLMESAFEAKDSGRLTRLVVELACSGLPHNYGGYKTEEPLRLMSEALGIEPAVNEKKRAKRAQEKKAKGAKGAKKGS